MFWRKRAHSSLFHIIICRIFEGDPSEITTLCEAEYREQVLQETLKQVQLQKVSFITYKITLYTWNIFIVANYWLQICNYKLIIMIRYILQKL